MIVMCNGCGEHKDCDKNLAKTSAPHKKEKGKASFKFMNAVLKCRMQRSSVASSFQKKSAPFN